MILLRLALKSISNRLFSTLLTVISIALSIALLLSVERTRRAAEEGFTQSISQVDLLVGSRTGPLNLILYTVFNMGSASSNISWKTYEAFKNNPTVEWTIPYSLGDGHKGFRVVATDQNFYRHYRFRGDQTVQFREGKPALGLWDVVIGGDVAKKLGYKVGDQIVLAHGVTHGQGIQHHDDKPFTITGVLQTTGTALDQSLYISLEGMEAIHLDWQNGAAPTKATAIPAEKIEHRDVHVHQITAFFLRTKSRIETLQLQRTINTYTEEPLLAIIPGATLAELWRSLGQVETVLKVISWLVLFVGLASMLGSLLAGLNERRREMSILRAIGASPWQIAALLVFESAVLTLIGIAAGLGLELSAFFLLREWLAEQFNFYLSGPILTGTDFIYLAACLILGTVVGLLPAWKATRSVLKDGLAVKT